MTDKSIYESSDSVRNAKPLKYAQYATFAGPFQLERGSHLPEVTAAYETYGTLSPNRDNAVLICHAISGDSHVARHGEQDDPGWWDIAVGPGKAIDACSANPPEPNSYQRSKPSSAAAKTPRTLAATAVPQASRVAASSRGSAGTDTSTARRLSLEAR